MQTHLVQYALRMHGIMECKGIVNHSGQLLLHGIKPWPPGKLYWCSQHWIMPRPSFQSILSIQDSAWVPFLHHGYLRITAHHRGTWWWGRPGIASSHLFIFGRLHCFLLWWRPLQKSKDRSGPAPIKGCSCHKSHVLQVEVSGGTKAAARVSKVRLQRVKASNSIINKHFLEWIVMVHPLLHRWSIRKLAREQMKRLSDKERGNTNL